MESVTFGCRHCQWWKMRLLHLPDEKQRNISHFIMISNPLRFHYSMINMSLLNWLFRRNEDSCAPLNYSNLARTFECHFPSAISPIKSPKMWKKNKPKQHWWWVFFCAPSCAREKFFFLFLQIRKSFNMNYSLHSSADITSLSRKAPLKWTTWKVHKFPFKFNFNDEHCEIYGWHFFSMLKMLRASLCLLCFFCTPFPSIRHLQPPSARDSWFRGSEHLWGLLISSINWYWICVDWTAKFKGIK